MLSQIYYLQLVLLVHFVFGTPGNQNPALIARDPLILPTTSKKKRNAKSSSSSAFCVLKMGRMGLWFTVRCKVPGSFRTLFKSRWQALLASHHRETAIHLKAKRERGSFVRDKFSKSTQPTEYTNDLKWMWKYRCQMQILP